MSQPQPYAPTTNFQETQGGTIGPQIDTEFVNVQSTTDQIRANLELLQRDDGALHNAIVTPDSLSTATLALIAAGNWIPRGIWATATLYAIGNVVEVANGGGTYVAVSVHTSAATFQADYDAGKWVLLFRPTTVGTITQVSSLGASPTTAAVQAWLDDTRYYSYSFDQNCIPGGNVLVKRSVYIRVEKGVTVGLPTNYTINASKYSLAATGAYTSTGQAVGFFHVDTANNTSGSMPGVSDVQIDIYGDINLGFKNGARACGVFARRAYNLRVNCPGEIYGAWAPIHLTDCDNAHVLRVNAVSGVIDTGSGPNAVVVCEGTRYCTIEHVRGSGYEEGIDPNANNFHLVVNDVRCNGDEDIMLEFTSITGAGWIQGEVVTQTTDAQTVSGYVERYDVQRKRLFIKGSPGPWLTTSAISNSGGSGTSGTPTRVATATGTYATKLVLTNVVGTPVINDVLVKGSASGKVVLWQVASSTVWLSNVTGARFSAGVGIAGGGLTSADVSTVTDSFQGQNGMDISNCINCSFTDIKTHNRIKCLEVFDYPLHSVSITLAVGASAPNVGEFVTQAVSGGHGQVVWYNATSRIIEIGDYTAAFDATNAITGDTTGNGGTATALNYVQDGRAYSERFTGKANLRNKNNFIRAEASYDEYWIGTGTLSSISAFDVKAGDDCVMHLTTTITSPTGDLSYGCKMEGGNRIGPPTDSTPPHLESTQIFYKHRSTKAPAFNTRDILNIDNPVGLRFAADIVSPLEASHSGVNITKTGTNKFPCSIQCDGLSIIQASSLATDALPAAAGTGITCGAIPMTMNCTPLYYNVVTRESLNSNNVTRGRQRRRFERSFNAPGAGSTVAADSVKTTAASYNEYSMAAEDEIHPVAVNFDLSGGAAQNLKTLWARAIGVSDGTLRLETSNPNKDELSGSVAFAPGAIGDGVGTTGTITVTGAVLTDYVIALSFSVDLAGATVTAWVSGADTVSFRYQNESGGSLTPNGTMRCIVRQRTASTIAVAAGAKFIVTVSKTRETEAVTIPVTSWNGTLPNIGELFTSSSTGTGVLLYFIKTAATTGTIGLSTLLVAPIAAVDTLSAPSGFAATCGTPVANRI